jgi:subtilisin family serine protease
MRGRRWSVAVAFLVICTIVGSGAAASAAGTTANRNSVAKIDSALSRQFRENRVQTFVVEFRDRANLGSAHSIRGFVDRGAYVYRTLRATAATSQAAARSLVAKAGAASTSYWIVNELVVTGDGDLARSLAKRPEVSAVRLPRTYAIVKPVPKIASPAVSDPEWGVAKIGADQVWNEGITGQGIVVANLDTGVDYTHPALVDHYRGNNGDGTFTNDYNWWDPTGICGDSPCDNAAHGTHTMGTMVGGDGPGPFTPDVGVAPGAKWIAAKGCEDFGCSEESLLSGGQFLLAPTDLQGNNPDPAKRPDVINNSWGSDDVNDTFFLGIVQSWRGAGIIPVFSNGNNGYGVCGTAGTPGNFAEVLGIGATDINDQIADFSSLGPAPSSLIKPDVSAPGVDVTSSVPGGGYDSFSGTSMAAPHTTGTIALMLSAKPALLMHFDEVATALKSTAVDRIDQSCGGDADGDPNNVYGDGRIDALAAVDLVKAGGTLAGAVTDADTGDPIAGAQVTASNGSRDFSATTDSSGAYSLFLAEGTYSVTASSFGYEDEIAGNVEIVTDQTTDRSFALAPLPRFSVSGVVQAAESSAPIAGVKVVALGTGAPPAFTNRGGLYSLTLPSSTATSSRASCWRRSWTGPATGAAPSGSTGWTPSSRPACTATRPPGGCGFPSTSRSTTPRTPRSSSPRTGT